MLLSVFSGRDVAQAGTADRRDQPSELYLMVDLRAVNEDPLYLVCGRPPRALPGPYPTVLQTGRILESCVARARAEEFGAGEAASLPGYFFPLPFPLLPLLSLPPPLLLSFGFPSLFLSPPPPASSGEACLPEAALKAISSLESAELQMLSKPVPACRNTAPALRQRNANNSEYSIKS